MAEPSWQHGAGRPELDPPSNAGGWADRRLGPVPPVRAGVRPTGRGAVRLTGRGAVRLTGRGAVRLTGRGGVLLMVAAFALGLLAQAVTGWAVLAGLGFAAGAAAAARYTKPDDLLTVAVTPPLVFFCVLLVFKGLSATGNVLFSIAGGSALSLAAVAPWLFVGTAVSLTIAFFRGLPRCLVDLRRGGD